MFYINRSTVTHTSDDFFANSVCSVLKVLKIQKQLDWEKRGVGKTTSLLSATFCYFPPTLFYPHPKRGLGKTTSLLSATFRRLLPAGTSGKL
jgi:hypothetical protein